MSGIALYVLGYIFFLILPIIPFYLLLTIVFVHGVLFFMKSLILSLSLLVVHALPYGRFISVKLENINLPVQLPSRKS